jgi:DNA-binding beta-propeller fold protein YncE
MEQWQSTLTYQKPVFHTEGALYPNPTTNYITLTGVNDNAKISILDMNGRKVKELRYSIDKEINVSELNKGTYLMIIQDSNGSALVNKLIKY